MGKGADKAHAFNRSVEKTTGKSACTYIFVHDIGFDKRFWFPIMTDIGADVCAIAYDLDGFGAHASNALPPHTMEHHVDNLFDTLSRLRVKNPVLIGMRFGGHVVLQALRREPDRFSGAMVGGVLPYAPTVREYAQVSEMISSLPKEGSVHYADQLIADLHVDQDNSSQLRLQIGNSNPHNIAAALTASLTRPSSLQALLDFPHPVCLLSGGEQEERIQKECITISLNKRRMIIVRVPKSTTLCNLENPHAFRSATKHFIELFEKE